MKRSSAVLNILTAICGTFLALIASGTTPAHAQGNVDFVIVNAPAYPVHVGDTFSVIIQVQAGAQQAPVAEIHLDFDPAILNVVSMTPGSTLPVPLPAPAFDNSRGTIDYGAATFSTAPSGTFDLLTITFEAMVNGNSAIGYSFVSPRETIAAYLGQNVLGSADDIQIQVGDSTVAVTLGWFLAERNDDAVDFHWQTATETGSAGFHLLAAAQESKIRLNDELIPSSVIDSVTPTDYSFSAVTDATDFYLQEVGVDGAISEYGPFGLNVAQGAYSPVGNENLTLALWLPLIVK